MAFKICKPTAEAIKELVDYQLNKGSGNGRLPQTEVARLRTIARLDSQFHLFWPFAKPRAGEGISRERRG